MDRMLKYRIEFLSDWHIGTGAGVSGDVDRLTARDVRGLPYVPAKTMTGMWRDACERLAVGLDGAFADELDEDAYLWAHFVEDLFGAQTSTTSGGVAPSAALVRIRPARYRTAVSDYLCHLSGGASLGTVTVVRKSTAIDPETGTARRGTLRSVEMGRATSVLEGELEIGVGDDERADVVGFLQLAAGLIDQIGGKRRRGTGRCRVTVIDATTGSEIDADPDRLSRNPPRPAEAGPSAGTSDHHVLASSGTSTWRIAELKITTRLPVIIPRQTLGNVLDSHDHIGGRQVLAAFCGVLREAGLPADDLVATDRLRVTSASPVDDDGRRLQPMPFALSQEKHAFAGEPPRIINSLVALRDPDVQFKQLRSGWVRALGSPGADPMEFRRHSVHLVERTHATVADEQQRPTSDIGGVFTYHAIAAGQSFAATIGLRVPDDMFAEVCGLFGAEESMSQPMVRSMGTSRKDDYGQVELSLSARPPVSADAPTRRVAAGETLMLWCLSDVVILDEMLRPSVDVGRLRDLVADALSVDRTKLEVDTDSIRARSGRHDAWNAAWGLPQPSLVSLDAGSVVRLKVLADIDLDEAAVSTIRDLGIGERCAAGFGRVAIDDPLLAVADLRASGDPGRSEPLDAPADVSDEERFAAIGAMEAAVWSRRIESVLAGRLAAIVKDLGLERVSSTQLNGLRTALAQDRGTAAFAAARSLLERPLATKRWNEAALKKVRSALESPSELWKVLYGPERDHTPPDDLAPMAAEMMFEAAVRSILRGPKARAGTSRGVDDGA